MVLVASPVVAWVAGDDDALTSRVKPILSGSLEVYVSEAVVNRRVGRTQK
jgi:hypothetical protein